ncbi:GAF domain-containing sensor histidine kinase [Amycolatopsis nalaikhensis]|uniref:GAF domain-containing protein n=1 Tax=Amycolatopsis nalaikhensis TaxID=715472 RepID=A0ABY8Y2L4_9PSEU|nr:GAF domain-containing sensor histidine kinase [Amycolatopsis sp. 2-2]WIV62259.1 GAF domain-containing protein [Amycolatopsis sp. 2-2]
MPAILAAVGSIARELELPSLLERAVTATGELLGARRARLELAEGGVAEYGRGRPGDGAVELPVRAGTRTFGTLVVEPGDGGEFNRREREVLSALTAATGMAVEKALLVDQMRRRERWLEASYDVTEALLGAQDLRATLRLIAERARVVAGGTAGAIARPTGPAELVFDVVEPPGEDADRLIGLTVPAEGTATGVAFTTRRPVVVRDYGERVQEQQRDRAGPMPAMIKDLDSAISVPLLVGEDTLGVLVVAKFRDKSPFTDSDVQLAETFAGHAALAVEFSRAQEARQRLAVFEDRDRIARDLHDLVIQRLFATGLGLEGVSRLIADPAVAARVAGFAQDLDGTIREIRNSIFSLQAPAQAQGSLRAELLRVALDARDTLGFEPRVGFDGPLDAAVPDAVRTDLTASLREALTNVARHAGATTCSVEVTVDPLGRRLNLVVRDDGAGPPPGPGRVSGLANLAARAARWSGNCGLVAAEGGGSRLEWTAELPAHAGEHGSGR